MEMNQYTLISKLPKVDINGFFLSIRVMDDDGNNILISRGGKSYRHFYISRQHINKKSDYERVMMDTYNDFIETASIGAKGYAHFKAKYGDIYETEEECKWTFKGFARAYEGLKRLDPHTYAELIN